MEHMTAEHVTILHLALPSLITGIIIFICGGVTWLVQWDSANSVKNIAHIRLSEGAMIVGILVVIFSIFWANIVGW